MISTDLFEHHYYEVHGAEKDTPTYLLPFGDIHWDSPKCSMDRWHEWCEWAAKKKNSLFLGMGDYFDSVSTHERRVFLNPDLHDDTIENLETFYRKQVHAFAKEIKFMKGRLIGLIEGNHHVTFADGTTSTHLLCSLLETKYLGVMAAVRLSFRQIKGFPNNFTYPIDIVAHHGLGASRLLGGSINKVAQMSDWWEADLFLMGHDHQKIVAEREKLKISYSHRNRESSKVVARKVVSARTGTFLKGYAPGKSSYAAAKVMPSTTLGTIKVELTPRRFRHRHTAKRGGPSVPAQGYRTLEDSYIDIHVSI